jgi:hypothetical protein
MARTDSPRHQADEDPLCTLMLLSQGSDGLCGWRGHGASLSAKPSVELMFR